MTGKKRVRRILLALVLTAVICFGGLMGVVLGGIHDDFSGEEQIVIVLGCQVLPSGAPSTALRDRLDAAVPYLKEHPEAIVVVSGGQGYNEPVTEAFSMAQYLMEQGIEEDRILLEEQSRNTNQNLVNAIELLGQSGYDTTAQMLVVSNGFHLARVRMIWSRVACGNLSTLSAPYSHDGSRAYTYVREALALVKSFFLDRG